MRSLPKGGQLPKLMLSEVSLVKTNEKGKRTDRQTDRRQTETRNAISLRCS
jgi:hypothetical protein